MIDVELRNAGMVIQNEPASGMQKKPMSVANYGERNPYRTLGYRERHAISVPQGFLSHASMAQHLTILFEFLIWLARPLLRIRYV